jgi:transcriptional regulator with XRE-family HTH domain
VKLYEKIIQLRKEKKLKITDVHSRIKDVFKNKALSYRTLLRIENGYTDGRASSIEQICTGLGVTLKELEEGTEKEFAIADFLSKKKHEGKYVYNDSAYAEILTGSQRRFLVQELVLKPGGKTNIDQDPLVEERFEKWVYVLKGRLVCVVKDVRFSLKKADCISFNSSLPHYFENNFSGTTHCLIVQNPRHI